MINFTGLKEVLLNQKNLILTTHINPDADAIGSLMAMYHILKQNGKTIRPIIHNSTPSNMDFLDPHKVIEKYESTKHDDYIKKADAIVILDLNHLSRVKSMEAVLRKTPAVKICIDHHQEPEQVFDHLFSDTDACATSEILLDFIRHTQIAELDKNIAQNLYAAIMTDTGSFRFERTTPKVHRDIAALIENGADPGFIYRMIFDRTSIGRMILLGETLTSMKLFHNNKLCYQVIYRAGFEKSGSLEEDIDGFVNHSLAIDGVKIGILFFELKDGVKISFRSSDTVPVNKLAAEFGGGGHTNAAGSRIYDKELQTVIQEVLAAAGKYLDT